MPFRKHREKDREASKLVAEIHELKEDLPPEAVDEVVEFVDTRLKKAEATRNEATPAKTDPAEKPKQVEKDDKPKETARP